MKILVAVKRVIDPYVKIRVKADGSGVETQHVKMVMNPFDEIAVEAAVQLKEQGLATEIIAVSIGPESSQEVLLHALAFGMDKAIHVAHDSPAEPLHVAKILKSVAQQQEVDLVLMGKQAIDNDQNQSGQMLAGLLGWAQGAFVSAIQVEGDKVIVGREVDGGIETLSLKLPAVLTTDLRLNVPRYPSLPNIMQAKSKPLDVFPLETFNLTLTQHVEVTQVASPPGRNGGERVADVNELVNKLREQAKVI